MAFFLHLFHYNVLQHLGKELLQCLSLPWCVKTRSQSQFISLKALLER